MHIYWKNNPAKLHPNLIWNDRPLGFFEECHPNKKNNNDKMSSDMGSAPEPIMIIKSSQQQIINSYSQV